MKQRAALAAVLAVGILAGYGILANLPEPLDGQIHGTYSCDAAVYTKVIAMDSRDGNAFYYADSQNNLYIKGAFEKKGENVYAVSCDSGSKHRLQPPLVSADCQRPAASLPQGPSGAHPLWG